ncbi:hypothetical protein FB33_2222 [Cutibacterium acnes]|nr:hypothetical protein FB33_2222 [Cutibacterium acnes]
MFPLSEPIFGPWLNQAIDEGSFFGGAPAAPVSSTPRDSTFADAFIPSMEYFTGTIGLGVFMQPAGTGPFFAAEAAGMPDVLDVVVAVVDDAAPAAESLSLLR